MSAESFRVDLRGIVDILSHHLYSSPRVYLRELIQNARDAVVARGALEALERPEDAVVMIDVGEPGVVVVRDGGIGLTEDEMRTVLATIGASSKREDLTRARRQYLGQFGIGLLSCFLIADRIEVRSRSARRADAPTLSWIGRSDGTFMITAADEPLAEPGTEVRVRARPDDQEWVEPGRVRLLAERFAGLLDLSVVLRAGDSRPDDLISDRTPPWRDTAAGAETWCRREFGFGPLAMIPVEVAAAGVIGVAFVADTAGRVGSRRGDTVYSHGMFVSDSNVQLVPDWAYFVRLVVEAGDLPLTASRESLQDSTMISEVSEQIGRQIRDGIERFADRDPAGFVRFLDVHAKGLLAMAVSDADMLGLVLRHVLWETSEGPLTLTHALRLSDTVRWTPSMTDFTAFAPVLRARRTLLINGSYVYGTEILRQVQNRPGRAAAVKELDATAILDELAVPDDEPEVRRLEDAAQPVLDRLGVRLDLRRFDPASVAALYVRPRGGALGGGAPEDDPDPWGAFFAEPSEVDGRPRLVVNVSSTAVGSVMSIMDERVRDEAITGLYVIGLLTAGQPLDQRHHDLLGSALHTLIGAAGRPTAPGTGPISPG